MHIKNKVKISNIVKFICLGYNLDTNANNANKEIFNKSKN